MYRQYRDLEHGEFILVGCDTATGGLDYSVAQFLSKTNFDVPLVYQSKQTTVDMTNRLMPVLEHIYDITGVAPVVAYERNNGGSFELERLATLNRLNKYRIYIEQTPAGMLNVNMPKKMGWTTNTATRPKMLEDLKNAIDNQVIRIYDKETVNQMFSFIVNQLNNSWKAEAEQGAHDDLVMALAIAWQLYQTEEFISDEDVGGQIPSSNLFKGGFY